MYSINNIKKKVELGEALLLKEIVVRKNIMSKFAVTHCLIKL